ncbi:uncharacterized protein MEPE_02150 [Melanopsichium pennsylvanicum]|uniref:PXA domain-containing protein n=2 Tax=Melanopsichium pennsylvanicum TaxID=63383 RepID=A0AAJ5C4D7_9BASI|nr:hypothetical protein BN887_05379 [Melanopsichium pennsylvanicum 4]SNX83443.1 uncharacterized protein MEPE_02150 [Melanopsichium pennsylvanicum]
MSQLGQEEQPAAAAPATAAHDKPSPTLAPTAPVAPINHINLILTALTAGLVLALLAIGLWNAILVVAVAMLLVCNPWVRTLLELPSTDGKRGLSTFDPARYLLSYTSGNPSDSKDASADHEVDSITDNVEDDPLMQTEQLLSLTVMPDALRESSQAMIRFVVRDFVLGWYDNLTFAHPNFPISAEANISHTAASIYLRSRQLKSANTAAEILLTVQSVLLSSLRRRRASNQYGPSAASSARSTWPSTAARVDALRKAIRKLLSRNLAHAERSSPVVMLLLTEILAKQAWQVVQTIGDPDFINQQIVQFAEPASETSLEAQAISPEELERLKSLDTAALEAQVIDQPTSADYPVPLTSAPAPRSRPVSTDLTQTQFSATSRAPPAQSSRQHSPEEAPARQGPPVMRSSAYTDPRSSYGMAQRAGGGLERTRPRATPPRKSNSSGPLSALGGFATGALGALADAAERAVDVVGGTVDEFGNLLMVPAESSGRSPISAGGNSSGDSPRRRYALLAEREQDEHMRSQSRNASGNYAPDSSAPAYHLDVPSGVDEPPLPDSLHQSIHTNNNDSARAFDIPSTPERRSMDAPSIVAPAPVAAALNFPIRDSFSIDETQEDEASSLASMQSLLSDRTSAAYEAFETFLETPSNRYCASNEGESLLRLHTQLNTLSSIMEFATLDEQTFRADASTILSKALEQLPGTLPPTHNGERPVLVRRSAQQVLTNLEWCANMDVVEPLRENILARMVQLHNAFTAQQHGHEGGASQQQSRHSSPNKSRFSANFPRTDSSEVNNNQLKAFLDREDRPSFSSAESDRPTMRYEPRRKTTAPNAVTNPQPGMQTPQRAPSVPPVGGVGGASVMGPPSGPSRPMSVPPRVPSAPPKPQQMVIPGSSSAVPRQQVPSSSTHTLTQPRTSIDTSSPSTVISVVDISANAESTKSIDPRTYEVMISVEGVSDTSDAAPTITSPDGFILVRRWHEFEAMDIEIQRQPRSSSPLPRLPVVKGRRSAEMCRLLEGYIFELLTPANRPQIGVVQGARKFFDRTRAGASAEDLRKKGGVGGFLGGVGKGLVSGVGMVGKQAAKTGNAGVQALSTAPTGARSVDEDTASPLRSNATQFDASSGPGIARTPDPMSARFTPSSPAIDSASGTTSAFVSRTNSPSPSPSSRRPGNTSAPPSTRATSQLSSKHLDMLLSSIFAVADEAFNLQGGWTLRRGMLRVLEQVVRTTYASSIVAGFNNSAAGLNVDNFAKWISDLTNTMWPNGRHWGSEIGTPDEKVERAAEEKQRTAEKAREIVVSYAPAQAGFMLGPGGKVACVKALAEVHATLMDPVTSIDLGLTVVLKALDMASR